MRYYELGGLTTLTAINTVPIEFRAIGDASYIEELGLFLTAATATTLGFGRPANATGAGGTVLAGDADLGTDEQLSSGGVILSGQTTAPTAPTTYKRTILIPGAVGNGIVWTWPRGLRVKPGTSLTLTNIAASSALRFYVRWYE